MNGCMSEQPEDRALGHVLPNILSNLVFMLANFITGLLLVPYYIDVLGVSAYAIIPVATSVTGYITLISDALSSTVSRYLTIDLRTDMVSAKRTFNAAVIGFTWIVLAAAPLVLVISVVAPMVFDISTNTVESVRMLFTFVIAAVLISVWSNNFVTVMYAKNRIDLTNVVKVTQIAVQVAFIVLFFSVGLTSVEYVGLAYLVAAVAFAVLGYTMARKVCPDLRVVWRQYDRSKFKEISSIGGWVLVNNLGNLLFIQASLLIVNLMMGSEQSGYFSIVVTLVTAMSSLVDTMGSVFAPVIYQLYSDGKTSDMLHISRTAVKVVGLVMAMPVAFLCAFSTEILTMWVGHDYVFLSEAVWVTMIVMIGIGSITPAYPLTMVHLKIKVPGIATLLFGIANVISAVALISFTSLGLLGVALSWAVTMFVKNCIFNPWYIARISGMGRFDLHRSLLYGFGAFAVLLAIYCIIEHAEVVPASWVPMIVLGVVLLLIHVFAVLRWMLRDDERETVSECLPDQVRKYISR